MGKLLVLVRHGQRDNSQRDLDNGLTDKGREQARMIRRFFSARFQPDDFKKGLWLVSSPKRRCIETLTPIAKGLDRTVDIHPDLEEQTGKESLELFMVRIRRFLDEWRSSKAEITVLCSHGDWLPLAAQELLGTAISFKKGCWVEAESQDGQASLRWLIPTFKPLISE